MGKKVLLGGNYGPAAISLLNKSSKEYQNIDYYVIEVSSFQLAQSKNFKPYISCLLNITPDHLDIHKSYKNYIEDKFKIFNRCNWAVTPNLDNMNLYDKHLISSQILATY